MNHPTTGLKLPRRLRPASAEIDTGMAVLIKHLWRLGFTTHYCCQGDHDHDGRGEGGRCLNAAYIKFDSSIEAALFASFAGPLSWDARTHKQRHAENPTGTERWTWDWWVVRDVVRFPTRDIPRVTARLAQLKWRLARIGAQLAEKDAHQCAPGGIPKGLQDDIAKAKSSKPALRSCEFCTQPIIGRRRDARFCSRDCQLQARDRAQNAPESTTEV